MNGTEVTRVLELHSVIRNSTSMGEIYMACKEIVKLHDGYEVTVTPNNPGTSVGIYTNRNYTSPPPEPPADRLLIEGQEPTKP